MAWRRNVNNVVAQNEFDPEKQTKSWKVEEDRTPQMDAAIPAATGRVMKFRWKLIHSNLISEVTNQYKPAS